MGLSRIMHFRCSGTVKELVMDALPPMCGCVAEHQNFVKLPNGEKLKIDLILNSSLIRLYYSPDRDPTPRLLLDNGALTSASGAS